MGIIERCTEDADKGYSHVVGQMQIGGDGRQVGAETVEKKKKKYVSVGLRYAKIDENHRKPPTYNIPNPQKNSQKHVINRLTLTLILLTLTVTSVTVWLVISLQLSVCEVRVCVWDLKQN